MSGPGNNYVTNESGNSRPRIGMDSQSKTQVRAIRFWCIVSHSVDIDDPNCFAGELGSFLFCLPVDFEMLIAIILIIN